MMQLDKVADEQLMAVTLAKIAVHNKQRRVATLIIAIALRLDWELYQAAEQPPTKEGE